MSEPVASRDASADYATPACVWCGDPARVRRYDANNLAQPSCGLHGGAPAVVLAELSSAALAPDAEDEGRLFWFPPTLDVIADLEGREVRLQLQTPGDHSCAMAPFQARAAAAALLAAADAADGAR